MRILTRVLVGYLLLLICHGFLSMADEPPALDAEVQETQKARTPPPFQYIRLKTHKVQDADVAKSLDVATAKFVGVRNGEKLEVDLVGALHVAEATYFRKLNERFHKYDAVLYELVAPKGTRIPRGGVKASGPISLLQGGMTSSLGLSYQLDEIDYTRKNFVHADMTPEEFAASMKRREESLGKMFFRAIGHAMAKQSAPERQADDLRVFSSMFSDNREHELKLLMAEQFADLNGAMVVYDGRDGSTLITERNKKALEVLGRQIDLGRRRLAIFYGAGHMRDMEEQLVEQFPLQRVGVDWLPAWDLEPTNDAANAGAGN